MISIQPIWAVVLRHIRMWRKDFNYMLGGFYWPVLDILVWGFLGSWVQRSQSAEFHNYEVAALLGILLWQVVGRGGNIMVLTLSEELWSNNIINLFSLPLSLIEWMIASVVFYAIMSGLISVFCMGVMFALYNVPIWYTINTYRIFLPPLFLCGIWIGFTCLQIVVLMGKRGVELGFVIGWFCLPFCGAYYPREVLPGWAQSFSYFIPMSYVFQGMRAYVMRNQDPTSYLIKGYILSAVYMVISIFLFVYLFNRSKQKGLARLAD
jgi:ABC-2 type transport system permease protein